MNSCRWLLILPFLIALGACESLSEARLASADVYDEGYTKKTPVTFAVDTPNASFEMEAPIPEAGPQKKRLLIYLADLRIRVANLEEAAGKFLALVESVDGYLLQRENETFTCRVPAERFDRVIAAIKEYGDVLGENLRAQDVTKQFMDLEIRLENALKARDRLLELLNRADKVADLLEVEKELKRLTEEIERMKGELRYLKDRIAFSTIQVTFNGPADRDRPRRRRASHFGWINKIGVEHVLDEF